MSTVAENGLVTGEDGLPRCWWHGGDADYLAYHDREWGRPVADDIRLYEKICLEGFQSGLSWLTILRKRDNFRAAFAGFDFATVAEFGDADIQRLLENSGIVRNRRKIQSTINNARRALELRAECGSLAAYFWRFEAPPAERPEPLSYQALLKMTASASSKALSKDLKQRGWSFVGPTTAYAFMQAMGLVNDHIDGCALRQPVAELRAAFIRPA